MAEHRHRGGVSRTNMHTIQKLQKSIHEDTILCRDYTQKANELERKIRVGTAVPEIRELLRSYRKMAEAMEHTVKSTQEYLQDYMRSDVSFSGLGVSEMKHIQGSQMISDAARKRSEASSLEAKAHQLEMKGLPGAADCRSKARSLRNEAASLERKGKALMK